MIILYTTGNSKTCRQAINWFKEKEIPFQERRICTQYLMTDTELKKILRLTENGFADIISYQSTKYIKLNIDIDDYTINDAIDLLIENPSLLKKPIILGENKLVVGYNSQAIRCFLPEEKRAQLLKNYYLSEIKDVYEDSKNGQEPHIDDIL